MLLFSTKAMDARRDIEFSLIDPVWKITDCIITLYLVHNEYIRNRVKTIAVSQIKSIPTVKGKYPTAKQLYKWTYYKKQDLITDKVWMKICVEDVEDKYGLNIATPIEKICNDVDSICYDYYTWISNTLSKCGRVPRDDAYNKLSILIS